MDILILVASGTSEFNFDRLFKIIDELCEDGVLKEKKVMVQMANSNYIPKNYESFSMIASEEYNKLVDESEFIITHAGTGSVVPALKKGKKIIVFPRLFEYNEHVDNHQLDLCEVFSKNNYVMCAKNKEELINCIKNISKFKPNEFKSNSIEFNNRMVEYIKSI